MSELRIGAGEWRGRRIGVPAGTVRPTADRVRESWMNIVRSSLVDARVIDLCAGSGALGLEALSRGASHCDFVEVEPLVLKALRQNIGTLGAGDRATVHCADALQFLDSAVPDATHRGWDVAFADPPYHQGTARTLAERWLSAPFATIFGVEHESALTLPGGSGELSADRRVYGQTAITFYGTGR